MRIFIKVADSLRLELAEKFHLSKVSIWSALNYLTYSDRAESVRRYALKHGGSIVEQDFTPNCRIKHTTTEIIQTFAGGIQVRINRQNSHARVLQDDTEIESYYNVTVQSWGNLLHHAQELSEQRVAEAAKK